MRVTLCEHDYHVATDTVEFTVHLEFKAGDVARYKSDKDMLEQMAAKVAYATVAAMAEVDIPQD